MTKNLREEYEKIIETMNHYYQAQVEGNSEILKPVCHKNAIMHGFAGETLLEGSIENLFAFIDKTGKLVIPAIYQSLEGDGADGYYEFINVCFGPDAGTYFAGGCCGKPGHHSVPEKHLEGAFLLGKDLK